MNEHFIKNIEIKNFKCFENFSAEGFGRVNLIGGKNNVGKTAFMEAIYIISYITDTDTMEFINPFLIIEELRKNKQYINENNSIQDFINIFDKYKSIVISRNLNNFSIRLKVEQEYLKEKFIVNDRDIQLERKNLEHQFIITNKINNNFIPSVMIEDKLILSLYDKIKAKRKRNLLNKKLTQFDKNILEFDVIENKPQVFLKNINTFQSVSELGHGLKRYIAIVSSILINKDGVLFLDEIENGIHYTNLDKLWEIILTISKEQNVQVFATTHSKECIESYARVAKKLKDENITFIELCKRKEEIKAFVYPYDWFIDEIEQEHEVRGCL